MLGFMKVQQPGSPIHNTLTMSLEVISINSYIPPKKNYSIIFSCVCTLRMYVCASLHCTLNSYCQCFIVSYTIGSTCEWQPLWGSHNPFTRVAYQIFIS